MKQKLKNKKGFTLVELLVVVAIVAILVAISIPMVTGALEKARTETDNANKRAAEGAAMIEYLLKDGGQGTKIYTYNADTGTVIDTGSTEGDVNSSSAATGITGYNKSGGTENTKVVNVKIDLGGGITSAWVDEAS